MHEILELSGPVEGYYYAEGHSGKLPLIEAGGTWFCFEEPWVRACMYLQALGFTAQQILHARDIGEV